MSRSALIGPIQHIRTTAIGQAANVAPFLKELDYLDVPELWYSTTIQSGVESLEIIPMTDQTDRFSPFLQGRIKYPNEPDVKYIFALVFLALRNSLGLPEETAIPKELNELHWFLVELLLAAHRKRNLIYFDNLPDIQKISSLLPADFLLPVKNLFSAITHSTPIVAASLSSVTLRDVALFDELITSKVFRRYERSHSLLEDNNVLVSGAIESVTDGSNLLVSTRPAILKTKRVAVSLLPITSKVIDTVFGKLPGSLAELFAKALASWLQDEKRVVIYQFPDLLQITIEARMNDLLRAKFPGSTEVQK